MKLINSSFINFFNWKCEEEKKVFNGNFSVKSLICKSNVVATACGVRGATYLLRSIILCKDFLKQKSIKFSYTAAW